MNNQHQWEWEIKRYAHRHQISDADAEWFIATTRTMLAEQRIKITEEVAAGSEQRMNEIKKRIKMLQNEVTVAHLVLTQEQETCPHQWGIMPVQCFAANTFECTVCGKRFSPPIGSINPI